MPVAASLIVSRMGFWSGRDVHRRIVGSSVIPVSPSLSFSLTLLNELTLLLLPSNHDPGEALADG